MTGMTAAENFVYWMKEHSLTFSVREIHAKGDGIYQLIFDDSSIATLRLSTGRHVLRDDGFAEGDGGFITCHVEENLPTD